MQLVSFKLQENILKDVDNMLKDLHFNNRTEFIREAIRDKLIYIENQRFAKKIIKFKGIAKTTTSDEDLENIRNNLSLKLEQKLK